MKYKIFVINLDHSTERWDLVRAELDQYNVAYQRVSGINVKEEKSLHLRKHYSPFKNYLQFNKSLSSGEIGCYLSHMQCWKMIVEEALDFAIILEDDIEVICDLTPIIKGLEKLKVSWEYLKLGEYPVKRKKKVVWKSDELQVVKYRKLPSCTFGQAVSLKGARKLLNNAQRFGRPVDIDLQYTWEHGAKSFGLLPYCVQPRAGQASDIETLAKTEKKNKGRLISQFFVQPYQLMGRLISRLF